MLELNNKAFGQNLQKEKKIGEFFFIEKFHFWAKLPLIFSVTLDQHAAII
jgi:hypothetical protein